MDNVKHLVDDRVKVAHHVHQFVDADEVVLPRALTLLVGDGGEARKAATCLQRPCQGFENFVLQFTP